MTEVFAYQLRVDDFIPVYGRSGLHRIDTGPHRNVYSESFHYVNVTISDGTEVSFKDLDHVLVLRP